MVSQGSGMCSRVIRCVHVHTDGSYLHVLVCTCTLMCLDMSCELTPGPLTSKWAFPSLGVQPQEVSPRHNPTATNFTHPQGPAPILPPHCPLSNSLSHVIPSTRTAPSPPPPRPPTPPQISLTLMAQLQFCLLREALPALTRTLPITYGNSSSWSSSWPLAPLHPPGQVSKTTGAPRLWAGYTVGG